MSTHFIRRSEARLAGLTAVLIASAVASAAPVKFAQPVEIALRGRRVEVAFSVSAATDVAVAIRDRDGRIIRHLAAGVLGPNAPAPLAADSLSQSLVWDGTDDAGRPAPAGQYRVEVSLGLTAKLGRIIGGQPQKTGQLYGLAVGPEGSVYALCQPGRDTPDPRVELFDRKGKYARTLVPRPADLPLSRARPLGEVVLNDGRRIPLDLLPDYGRRFRQVPAVSPQGDLILVSGPNRGHVLGKRFQSVPERKYRPRRLLRIAADGGAPKAGYLGPVLGKAFDGSVVHLAMAPDGKTVYVSGARHAVFRTAWGEKEKLTPVAGTPDKPGGGQGALKDPAGIAVDPAGNLFVADRGNHRVLALTPQGKTLKRIPIEWPSQVLVHPKTGAIYVTAGYRVDRLVKFDKSGKQVSELKFRSRWPVVALDAEASPPLLYVGNMSLGLLGGGAQKEALVPVVDDGDAFRVLKPITDPDRPMQPFLLGVDRRRERVYAHNRNTGENIRLDGRTGRIEPFTIPLHPKANQVHELTVAADGKVAIHVMGEFGQLDPRLRPLPFAATGTLITLLRGDDCLRSFYGRGSCVGPNGEIYWVHERGGYSKPMLVTVLNADGSLKQDKLIVLESRSAAAIRVDRAGCVYLLDHLKPPDKLVPDDFKGKVPIERENKVVYNYGSLIKFTPAGGAIRELSQSAPQQRKLERGRLQLTTAEGRGDFVTDGVLWSYYGVSMIQPALKRNACMCWAPRFDLDEFGRPFVPDQLRARITVLDGNGNVILHFGRYGNAGEVGPDIVLADPRTVMVSREAAYVGDMTNSRVVRVDLGYRATAGGDVKLPAPAPQGRGRNRVAAVRKFLRDEAIEASPSLDRKLDWDRLAAPAARAAPDSMVEEARVRMLLASRDVRNWPPDEAAALLGKYLGEKSEKVRLAAVWALWNNPAGEAGLALLRGALKDTSAVVRVTAADTLLHLKDPSGLAEIFLAARSDDPNVFKLAETAILKKVLVWDADHPMARKLDTHSALVGAFPVGKAEVEALALLLTRTAGPAKDHRGRSFWYLRRAAIFLLGQSERPEAAGPLLDALQFEKTLLAGRNRNRVIGGLGLLRVRESVPELIKFLARGPGTADQRERGDKAEVFAAVALARIADPQSVGPITELLTSEKRGVAELARRTLSQMFDPQIPADRCLLPRGGKLQRVRIDELPEPAELQRAWKLFWRANRDRYPWNPKGPLMSK